ncbi:unnamed protein product [Arctia plantaginis]|uniref:Uncharacterized protein n=1 Tax=Arctia plantaginis TaxID=874455 RepID=A0A8S1ABJ2_ARCPL|nr:unnamed protein product [Arctia plantaginis]
MKRYTLPRPTGDVRRTIEQIDTKTEWRRGVLLSVIKQSAILLLHVASVVVVQSLFICASDKRSVLVPPGLRGEGRGAEGCAGVATCLLVKIDADLLDTDLGVFCPASSQAGAPPPRRGVPALNAFVLHCHQVHQNHVKQV